LDFHSSMWCVPMGRDPWLLMLCPYGAAG
jgi:hypothetical protein